MPWIDRLRLIAALTLLTVGRPLMARNVDLSTVPKRDSLQLTIYNSEDLTLVCETRVVTFKKGANPLEFSWANTLIDPSSVELKFLDHDDKLDVLDVAASADRGAHEPRRISYAVDHRRDLDGHDGQPSSRRHRHAWAGRDRRRRRFSEGDDRQPEHDLAPVDDEFHRNSYPDPDPGH